MALELDRPAREAGTRVSDRVEAGTRGAGEYRCLECGYGIVTFSLVPACPMCHGSHWEAARWSPFSTHAEEARILP
jgi:lipopolysaccharide biosynthesis regulator YciM